MSQKSAYKGHKLSVPRSTEEINREYGKLLLEHGQTQYVISMKQEELAATTGRLKALNKEADARRKLDALKAVAEATADTQGAKNE